MKKVIEIIAKLILAYLTTISIAGISGYGITGIEIMLPCIFALTFIVYHTAYNRIILLISESCQNVLKRDILCSLPVGILLGAAITTGAHYDIWNQSITAFGMADVIYFVMLSLFLIMAVFILFGALDRIGGEKENVKDTQKKTADAGKVRIFGIRNYVITIIILIICWLPYYLTLLPGNMGIDTFEEIEMCLGSIPWTNHHPVFFTMLIGAVIKLTSFGTLNFSMGVFATLQMLLFAATLSGIIGWLWENISDIRRAKQICIIGLLFFALYPVNPMFAIYVSKDVLFSCALVMLTISLYEMVNVSKTTEMSHSQATNDAPAHNTYEGFKISTMVKIAVWSLFTMMLRNNGLLIIIFVGIFLLIHFRREWKKILIMVGMPIAIFMLFRLCAYRALNVAPQSFAESASVPLQQTGYVIVCSDGDYIEGLSETENELLSRIMPYDKVREVYELGYTDCLKFDESFDDEYFNEHSREYMKVWLHLLPTHFSEYVKAYLAQTIGYWHYGETNTLCTQGVDNNLLGIERNDLIENLTGVSLFGIIEKLMLLVRKAPILCMLSSMAIQIYMVLLIACNYYRKKESGCIIGLLPVILLWITIMIATPAFCLFRYTFALFMLWPVWFKELTD